MRNEQYTDDLRDMRERNRKQGWAISGLIAALMLALLTVLRLVGSERTIVAPPNLVKAFWVTQDHVSREYLEQMGGYIAWLILDVTPSTIDWKKEALLPFVDPAISGAMKIRQEVESDRLKRLNATTSFLPQQLLPDEEQQSVVLIGRLRTQINGQDTSTVSKAYLAQFHATGGHIHLKEFKEVNNGQANTGADGAAAGAR